MHYADVIGFVLLWVLSVTIRFFNGVSEKVAKVAAVSKKKLNKFKNTKIGESKMKKIVQLTASALTAIIESIAASLLVSL